MKKTVIIIILCCIAFINASYLTGKAYNLLPGKTFCDINSIWSCGNVVAHPATRIVGVPFPLIAMIVYPVLGSLAIAVYYRQKKGLPYRNPASWLLGLSAGGLCFNSYIIYQETFTVKAFCPLCLLCTGIIIIIILLSYSLRYNDKTARKNR